MREPHKYKVAVSSLLGLLVLAACTPVEQSTDTGAQQQPDAGPQYEALNASDLADISAVIPSAMQRELVDIAQERLSDDDVENGNNQVWIIHDDSGTVVGYYRDIFSPVHCTSGVCQAIYYAMIYDVDGSFLRVLHPSWSQQNLVLKYWDGLEQPFNEADWTKLNALCLHPPAALLGVQSEDDLVADATETAPTVVEYQDLVVRGAAFTTYQIVVTSDATRQIIQQDLITN